MPLTGKQIKTLLDLLASSLKIPDELAQLTRTRLDLRLGDIVGIEKQPGLTIAFDLITWLEARGRTMQLLDALRAELPDRADVQTFCKQILADRDRGPVILDAGAVRARVAAFRAAFDLRKEWFSRLNAYKRLHEVLHKLLEMQVGIDEAVKQFHEDPPRLLRLERIANALEADLLDEATDANSALRHWLDRLVGRGRG
jgi:hypothetical protein